MVANDGSLARFTTQLVIQIALVLKFLDSEEMSLFSKNVLIKSLVSFQLILLEHLNRIGRFLNVTFDGCQSSSNIVFKNLLFFFVLASSIGLVDLIDVFPLLSE